eukprot:tig00000601_g2299.t1
MERPAYDVKLVEQILAHALELLWRDGYLVSLEHGVGGPAETSVRVETNDCDASITAYRVVTDFQGMPAAFATSAILSRSRTKDLNEFTVREELVAELEAAPPEDLQNIGVVELLEDHANFLGWVVESFMLRVTRRLPDGSAFGIRVPVEREAGVWTPRRYREKMRTLSAWHVARTADGCRFTYLALEKACSVFSYVPACVVKQLICRLVGKYVLRVRRIVLQEFAADGCAEARPKRSFLFASGSAGVPLHWGLDPAARPAAPESPFVLHAFAPPRHGAPPAPAGPLRGEEAAKTTEIFFDLVGVEQRTAGGAWSVDGGESWVAPPAESNPAGESPLSKSGQVLRAEFQEQSDPNVLSRSAEAARASLELSLRLESMSLAGLAPSCRPAPALPRPTHAPTSPHAPRWPGSTPPPPLSEDGDAGWHPPPPPLVPCPKPPASSSAAAAAAASSAAAASAASAAAVAAAAAAAAAADEDDDAAAAASAAAASAAASAASSAAAASAAASDAAASGEGPREWEEGDLSSGFSAYANEALPGAINTFPGAPLRLIISLLQESWRAMPDEVKAGYRARVAAGEGGAVSDPYDAASPSYPESPRFAKKARCCSEALAEDGLQAPSPPSPSTFPAPAPLAAPPPFPVYIPLGAAPASRPPPPPAPVIAHGHGQPGPSVAPVPINMEFVLHQLRAAWDSMSEEERARFVAAENSALGRQVFSLQALALAGALPAARGPGRRSRRATTLPSSRPPRPIVPAPAPGAPPPAPRVPTSPSNRGLGPAGSPGGVTFTLAPTASVADAEPEAPFIKPERR